MLQLLSFSKKTITNSLSIYVKSNTGDTLSVDLDPKWDIKDVKEFVAPQLGLQPKEMKIVSCIDAKYSRIDAVSHIQYLSFLFFLNRTDFCWKRIERQHQVGSE